MLQDEIQILKAVTEGDEKAFKKLFLYYYPKVVAFIREIIKDTKAAEDTAQDIFAKIWLIRLSLSGIHNFGSYLYVVSRNAALHYLKKSCPSVRIDEIDFIVDSAIDEKIQADEKGCAAFRGFYGDYEITVEKNGKCVKLDTALTRDQKHARLILAE